ncbi:MAG: hypothetical protein ABEN55_23365 [Bradymonadaceae bacterium]
MTESPSEIRNEWIEKWRSAAEEDDAEWLKEELRRPDGDPGELVDGMTTLLEHIPVEEPEEDWETNFLLHWQCYGIEPAEQYLVTVRLHGDRHAVLFAEPDSLDRIPFAALLEELGTERIVVENFEPDFERIDYAVAFIEEALSLTRPLSGSEAALPWTGDADQMEVELTERVKRKIERANSCP